MSRHHPAVKGGSMMNSRWMVFALAVLGVICGSPDARAQNNVAQRQVMQAQQIGQNCQQFAFQQQQFFWTGEPGWHRERPEQQQQQSEQRQRPWQRQQPEQSEQPEQQQPEQQQQPGALIPASTPTNYTQGARPRGLAPFFFPLVMS